MGCGLNSLGQLGLNDTTYQSEFTRIPNINNVIKISCGASHTFILLNIDSSTNSPKEQNVTHVLMGCGFNGQCQLGIGDHINRKVFTRVNYIKNIKNINQPTHSTSNLNIKQIACGGNHTFILLESDIVMSCGDNTYGQLSQLNNSNIFKIVDTIYAKSHQGIKQINCGFEYTYILFNDGVMMSCGHNDCDQLGYNHTHFNKVDYMIT